MATRAGLFLMVSLVATPLAREWADELIVWNVGQGQWVTVATGSTCRHFDAGGEFAPVGAVKARCRGLANPVTFSHWDLDHVGFAGRLAAALPGACVEVAPAGPAPPRRRRLLDRLPVCRGRPPFASWSDVSGPSTNARSRVSLWRDVLIPGDAPARAEERAARALKGTDGARWLVLGHHGSRTSTSGALLAALPHLRLAIASARRARYGHPHAEVRRHLRAARVPLLSTEDWGTIRVRL